MSTATVGDEWGVIDLRPRSAAARRAQQVEEYRLAVHAQQLRAEHYSSGYTAELAAFYGHDDAPMTDDAEQRLTFRDWLVGMADPEPDPDDLDLLPAAPVDHQAGMTGALEVDLCGRCGSTLGQYDRNYSPAGWLTPDGLNLCPAAADDYHQPARLTA